MQVHQRCLDKSMSQKFLQAHDIEPCFQQMRGIGVAQAMCGYGLLGVYFASIFFNDPLYPGGGNGPGCPIVGHLAVEQEGLGRFRCYIFFETACQVFAKGQVPVYFALLFFHKNGPSVKVDIAKAQCA